MARIVVVEDDESAASVVKSFLEQEGHLVKVFHNGAEAQSFILSNEADLIILDWDLPGLSGIEILRDFRTFGGRCPILMLTGHQSVEDKELGFDEGADDYLTKPYNMKELGARVKGLLRRSQAAIGNVASVGDIIVDFDTNKVMKSGRAITLAPREFQLLSFLVKNRKEEVSMDSLMTRVWTSDSEITPDILRTVVRRLTKKLDPDGSILRLDGILAGDLGPTGKSTLGMGSSSGGTADDDFDIMLGRVLDDKYELIKAIGGGASGRVYKARHKMMNVPVAVKILAPQLSTQPDLVRRFEREARAASLLRHPNIMLVHDMGMTEENQPYMVMELLDGFSLAELIQQNGKLTASDSLEIISQICRGIAKAHEEQLIHRDLKPGNIMLVAENEQAFTVKIVDFGLAKSTRPEESGMPLTQTGALIGTPTYMSPEQCQAEAVDQRSDIYAIGCMLFEMLTGTVPFPSSNIIEVLLRHAKEPPPPLVLPDQNPQLTRGFEYVIHTCLAKQPEQRYPTARHILADLERIAAVAK